MTISLLINDLGKSLNCPNFNPKSKNDMENKTCFKCGRNLPITEFYTHPGMADGHLNKCKDCTKRDENIRHQKKVLDPEWVGKERARGREKYHRLYSGENSKPMAHPETRSVRAYFKRRGFDLTGKEIHHWNYADLYDVFFLSPSQHKRVHHLLKFDKESKMFRYCGQLLNTRAAHQQAIETILSNHIAG